MNGTERNILNLIRKHKKLSNTEITKITGKHKSTISPCIQSLINNEFITTAGIGTSTKKGGKPPQYLELNSKKFYTIGLSIEPEQITVLITDFCGNIIQTHYSTYKDKTSKDDIISDIKESIIQIIQKESLKDSQISGIGIGISAQVDSKNGIIYKCDGLNLSEVPLKAEIEKLFPYPVELINDVNASLLAEKWFIHDPENINYENVIYLFIGSTLVNMGLGLYLNSTLYEGSNHHAGEMYSYQNDVRLANYSNNSQDISDFRIDKVKNFLEIDKDATTGLLNLYTDIISDKMVQCIELLNPQKLIIGGNVIYAKDEFLTPLINAIKVKTEKLFQGYLDVEITGSELDELATPLGATTLILKSYF
ncbi:MAG: ROK family transcriptional regulator [Spirochaetaceae bacterium]